MMFSARQEPAARVRDDVVDVHVVGTCALHTFAWVALAHGPLRIRSDKAEPAQDAARARVDVRRLLAEAGARPAARRIACCRAVVAAGRNPVAGHPRRPRLRAATRLDTAAAQAIWVRAGRCHHRGSHLAQPGARRPSSSWIASRCGRSAAARRGGGGARSAKSSPPGSSLSRLFCAE